jgi:cellobiose-specific phosphotransferase system component IIA
MGHAGAFKTTVVAGAARSLALQGLDTKKQQSHEQRFSLLAQVSRASAVFQTTL